MQIGSTAGASLSQLLSQMQARLASQTSSASSASGASGSSSAASFTTTTSSASTTTSISEDLSYLLSSLSDQLMSGLLNVQQQRGPDGGAPELSEIDSDGDGVLSQAEMEAFDTSRSGSTDTTRADRMFSAMDTDGDGSVTASEKSAFDETMAANGPPNGAQGGPPPGPPPSGGPEGGDQASASGSGSSTDLAGLLKELQSAIEAYSSGSLQAQASASVSSLSIAA